MLCCRANVVKWRGVTPKISAASLFETAANLPMVVPDMIFL